MSWLYCAERVDRCATKRCEKERWGGGRCQLCTPIIAIPASSTVFHMVFAGMKLLLDLYPRRGERKRKAISLSRGAGSVILGERAGWGAPASAKGEPGGSANGLKNGCSSYVCPVWCLSCVTCTDSFLLYMYWAVLPPNPPTHRSSEVFRRQISPAGRLPGPEVPILTGFAR